MRSKGDPTVIERQSVVDAAADRVWQRVVTPEGINDELHPWMTMSMPRGAASMTVDNVPIGVSIGRSWLRLFGVLPFDYDRLTIADLQPGRAFREESTMLSMRRWQHERSVTPDGSTKAVVDDRITFQLRAGLGLARPLIAAGITALFGHRHRRLQRHFAAR
jgi:ligand-binding SRPBCC domain-containing protein